MLTMLTMHHQKPRRASIRSHLRHSHKFIYPPKTALTHHCIKIFLRQPPSHSPAVNCPESLQEDQVVGGNRNNERSGAFHPRVSARILETQSRILRTQRTRAIADDTISWVGRWKWYCSYPRHRLSCSHQTAPRVRTEALVGTCCLPQSSITVE